MFAYVDRPGLSSPVYISVDLAVGIFRIRVNLDDLLLRTCDYTPKLKPSYRKYAVAPLRCAADCCIFS